MRQLWKVVTASTAALALVGTLITTAAAEPTTPPTPTPSSPVSEASEAAILQVTELQPDSTNVGGADGYEFIEVYNATDSAVDFSDFTINYLYPNTDLTIGNSALWPATPSDVVIPAGETLVFWIKNGPNADLGVADFNAEYATSLVAGSDIVEIEAGGMANGSLRGVEIITNTGSVINRAIYNHEGDDTRADQGIHYTASTESATQQVIHRVAPSSPGSVTRGDQVADALLVSAADTSTPVVTDATAGSVPPAQDFVFVHTITDDALVRTATLYLQNSADAEPVAHNMWVDAENTYTHTVPVVDLTGKRFYDYWLVATDGTNSTTTTTTRIFLEGVNSDPVRLNLTDGQYVSGSTQVVVGVEGPATDATLEVAGSDVTSQLAPALEDEPRFVFDVTSVNSYFQNGVLVDGDVLSIFDEQIMGEWRTLSVPVPTEHLAQGRNLSVEVWAGTKKAPEIDPDENNDDFEIRDLRLVLPDGRTLRPADFVDSATIIRMGDSAGKQDFQPAVFDVPADAFSARSHTWDTTRVADGDHDVVAANGSDSASARVVVDNTAPSVTGTVADGSLQKGTFTLDASATDVGVGVESILVTLDGEIIAVPLETSSLELAAGEHVLDVVAVDTLGNTGRMRTRFTTPEEQPGITLVSPEDNAEVPAEGVDLEADIVDPTGDRQTGSFNIGHRFTAGDAEVVMSQGVTQFSEDTERTDQQEAVPGSAVTSDEFLPYQILKVKVPASAGDDYRARLRWVGEVNPNARVSMRVLATDGVWARVAEVVSPTGDGPADVELEALVPAAEHEVNGEITVLIQHTDGWAGGNRSERTDSGVQYHPDAEPRSGYDFTVAHISDTQYYNANDEFHRHQQSINDFLVQQRDALNLQYVVHTGDIVDDNEIPEQWSRANPSYEMFDDARLPYGVLAGNHDVSQSEVDYTEYGQHFGDARFAANPWFGGSHENNRGHFELISAGGIDLLYLYMGWGPGELQIAWMNEVLARYPERVAVVNLHEYMLTTGGLGAIPQRIFDEVIAPNANVRMVQSGHYHDAYTRTDSFDDDGDGVDDRTVTSMLFDYQGLPEGGQGFLRLQHFDNVGRTMMVRTYSPSLEVFTSEDPTLEQEHQSFDIDYDTAGIDPMTKSLTTSAFTADILTSQVMGGFTVVAPGSRVGATWDAPTAEAGWYVVTRDQFGGEALSDVRAVRLTLTPTPTVDPTVKPSVKPSVKPTVEPSFRPQDVYTTPGYHTVSGRQWFTKCEPYSSTFRCWTSIWSTQVTDQGGKFVSKTGWFHNNLTYLPSNRLTWAGNPLGFTDKWTSADGRRWYTECDTAATGRDGCRSYTRVNNLVAASPKPGGGYTYSLTNEWVFNNIVLFQ